MAKTLKGLAKKGAIAMAVLAGLALMAKHNQDTGTLSKVLKDAYLEDKKKNGNQRTTISDETAKILQSRRKELNKRWDGPPSVDEIVWGREGKPKVEPRQLDLSQTPDTETWGKGMEDKSLGSTKKLMQYYHLAQSGGGSSFRDLVDDHVLGSNEHAETTHSLFNKLKQLRETHSMKKAAYKAGEALIKQMHRARKTIPKKAKLLAASALLSLGINHNEQLTSKARAVLAKIKPRMDQFENYLKGDAKPVEQTGGCASCGGTCKQNGGCLMCGSKRYSQDQWAKDGLAHMQRIQAKQQEKEKAKPQEGAGVPVKKKRVKGKGMATDINTVANDYKDGSLANSINFLPKLVPEPLKDAWSDFTSLF